MLYKRRWLKCKEDTIAGHSSFRVRRGVPAGLSFANATAGRTHMSAGWSTVCRNMGVAIRGLRRGGALRCYLEDEGNTPFPLGLLVFNVLPFSRCIV